MAVSTAVSTDRISRVIGYKLRRGLPMVGGVNLPQRIAILAPANADKQTGLPTVRQVTSANEAGELFGFGSPIHSIMRILKPPVSGDGVGGIPIFVYPQAAPTSSPATKTMQVTTTVSTVTSNQTHRLRINGRTGVDNHDYSWTVLTTDNQTQIAAKMHAAINDVPGSPVTASMTLNSNLVTLTVKYAGSLGNDLSVVVDTGNDAASITYAVVDGDTGAGEYDISGALTAFGSEWNTIVINAYGTNKLEALEQFNGVPDDNNPTGRYSGTIFMPFVALFGSKLSATADIINITGAAARRTQVTNVLCPAPNSEGWDYEAAANAAFLLANTSQNSPHLDVSGQTYPDMPVPVDGDIGAMKNYDDRDTIVKNGGSTVNLSGGRYQVQDFVTTYRPEGELPPQFRYVRSLVQDFNIRYGYFLLEVAFIRDKAIVSNDQVVTVSNVIKPKDWIQTVRAYADDLSTRALITTPSFMKESIMVQSSGSNPDRLNTFFRYRRSSFARIASTDAEANFSFSL